MVDVTRRGLLGAGAGGLAAASVLSNQILNLWLIA